MKRYVAAMIRDAKTTEGLTEENFKVICIFSIFDPQVPTFFSWLCNCCCSNVLFSTTDRSSSRISPVSAMKSWE